MQMTSEVRAVAMSLIACVFMAGCTGGAASESDSATGSAEKTLRVVCTTGQVGDMLKNLGGPHVRVETLMGPGVDPHLYRGTLSDTRKLSEADAVFYNGLHLEGRLAEVLENLAQRKPVFAVTEDIVSKTPERLRKPPEFSGNYDPHVWFDVELWATCAESAARRVIELDPAHADDYRKRANDYVKQLHDLHDKSKRQLAEIPAEQRIMVTAHDAFGYFGRAYDVEVHGLQGISTADEADLTSVQKLVDLLVSRKVKAVFVESSVPPKNIESLIQGCAAQGHTVVEGGQLYSDAMGAADTPEGTYVGMVDHNVRTIVKALK